MISRAELGVCEPSDEEEMGREGKERVDTRGMGGRRIRLKAERREKREGERRDAPMDRLRRGVRQ